MRMEADWLADASEDDLLSILDDCRTRTKEHRRAGRFMLSAVWAAFARQTNEALGELYRREERDRQAVEGDQLSVYDDLASRGLWEPWAIFGRPNGGATPRTPDE